MKAEAAPDWPRNLIANDGPVAHDWPPPFWSASLLHERFAMALEHRSELLWRPWYVRLRGKYDPEARYVAAAWFAGPADAAGVLDVRVSVVPSQQGKGIGSEVLKMLTNWPRMLRLATHFRATVVPSNTPAWRRVLNKNSFAMVGTDQNGVEAWIRPLEIAAE
ncbi:MAG: GNAT family protein [Phycisphaerales bacterium]